MIGLTTVLPDCRTVMDVRTAYQETLQLMRNVSDLRSAIALLSWDQETYMPTGAAEARAEQIATLSVMAHALLTNNRAKQLAEYFETTLPIQNDGLSEFERRVARVFVREVQQATVLPEDFVRRKARATTLAQEHWKQARQQSSFAYFKEDLTVLVELAREEASHRGYKYHPYDALLDLYEPGMTVQELDPLFTQLATSTRELLDIVASSAKKPDRRILEMYFPAETQLQAAREIVEAMGFDFSAGRIDLSEHPFCTSLATTDVRLTTRINDYDIRSCLFGLIHEAGHGLYEQGMRAELNGTFAREGASMGIHESQSLFWETIIARSEEFWHWALPVLRRYFPSQFGEVTPRQMYAAINAVKPSLVRIEADEITYNMHIILRYEIEKQLLEGRLSVDEIPGYWNDRFHQLLDLEVPNDALGCLQDIHWSFGGFGYFPSYTLGKLYAAMFRRALLDTIPETPQLVRNGNFEPIHLWLKRNIHQWGRTLNPSELVATVTGSTLNVDDFIEYARQKVQRIYDNA